MERVVKRWNRLFREVAESPPVELFMQMCHLWTWFCGGLVSTGLAAGLGDLRGLFQPKPFCGFSCVL